MNNVKINDEIVVDIKRLGINGEGIAYYLRKTIFINNALPKETVLIRITKDNDKFLEAEVIKIVKKSMYRVKPFCKYYESCGGCQLQHLDYSHTKIIKKEMLMQAISKYSNINPRSFQINDTVLMENSFNYRNKSQMPFCYKNKLSLSMYKANSQNNISIDNCDVQDKNINTINNKIIKLLEVFDITSTDNGGILKNLVTRISTNNEIQVTIIISKDNNTLSKVALEIIKIDGVVSVYKSINTSQNMFGNLIKLEGQDTITSQIGNFNFKLLPTSFFQLNTIQTNKLYELVKKACKLSMKETVIDAYCGVGTIGMYLSKNAKKIIGIEINQDAITNAIENAKLNKIKNIEFICGDATNVIPNIIKEDINVDIMVFDPPRTGLTNEIKKVVLDVVPKRIVYVSCNPSTLAKDLNDLNKIYNVKSITPVDMFPYTSHIESVTLLEKK